MIEKNRLLTKKELRAKIEKLSPLQKIYYLGCYEKSSQAWNDFIAEAQLDKCLAIPQIAEVMTEEHYIKRCDFLGKYLELAGQRRKKYYEASCRCGFRAGAYGKHLAECKIYGHQETMTALKGKILSLLPLQEEKK